MRRAPKIHISIGFAVLLGAALCFDRENMLFPALVCAALHEAAHLAAVYLCGGRVDEILFAVYGARITLDAYPILSYKKELLIAAAGPCASLAAAYALSVVGGVLDSQRLFVTAGISFILGMMNLTPAYPLDGGRMLRCAALMLFSRETAEAICRVVAFICAVGACAFCVFINARTGFQPSLSIFCMFVVCAFLKNSVR